jgi:hypothetical protein
MSDKYKFKFSNQEEVLSGLHEFVETRYNNSLLFSERIEDDYYGSFEWNKFTIYRQYKNRIVILRIEGEINEKEMIFTIYYPYNWVIYLNSVFGIILSLTLFLNVNLYVGAILFIFTVIQTIYFLNYINKRKDIFVDKIIKLIKLDSIT